ncbi:hypothetical protein DVT68_19935 [Dyella solisilvae]|uniref:Uncharacterized protein n=1 Tax=Dyella solisilvae TaxID=1920168 RepID=A0A370K2D9_9GAMM|nr:hypothetical protein [Dyella solisilvae]RDI96826.1 hypothetical protein DVT68_19935 [Dyella solisilvae]
MSSSEIVRPKATGVYVTALYIILILFSLLGGVAFTYWLSGLHTIPTAKLLNIAGIAYGLIGVLILSEAIVRSERVRQFLVVWVGTALLWVHTGLAFGVFAGANIVTFVGRPSAHAAYGFSLTMFVWAMWTCGVVDGTVTNPLTPQLRAMPERHQRLGLILLVTGLVLQLVAAIRDF